ncbi:glycoside hydrolase family 2 protein [Aspergillus stella-maris]|uniref:glycoside hydrolase family 2 protein n=1 Tax=Aspergillus stella-maris TaxID=1810926 RepID=UPI003CCDB1C2
MATEYPRPDFVRKDLTWTSLNGPWSFLFDDSNTGLAQGWQRNGLPTQTEKHEKRDIIVPYAFQVPASGINLQEAHEYIWYERDVRDIRSEADKRNNKHLLLRFGAVDYECTVWVDGEAYAAHRGGYVPFDVDITRAFQGAKDTARVTLRIRDSPTDLTQPRGKQYWGPVPESIFYTPTSGIWQDVWLEVVPGLRIKDASGGTVFRSDDVKGGKVTGTIVVSGEGDKASTVKITISLEGVQVGETKVQIGEGAVSGEFEVKARFPEDSKAPIASFEDTNIWQDRVAIWSLEHPTLYDVKLQLFDTTETPIDEIRTTIGMRNISWENGDSTFRLNGKPIFQKLCLDQGYWPETGLTPPSGDALLEDIILSKKVGLNGCRKHQKVEDPRFLYWADKLGFLVWGEIGNAYEFSDEYIDRFNDEWAQVVKRDRNHPCVVVWTPVNESWGYKNLKDNAKERGHIRHLYKLTKSLDPTRPINDNCGWESIQTDLTTYHDYSDSTELAEICSKMEGGILARKLNGEMFVDPIEGDAGSSHTPGAPVICSEFGGVNIAPSQNVKAGERDWGYTTAADADDLLCRLEKLFMAVVKGGHTCGFVYTQLTDIEQEVNGLYSYDRKEKVPAEKVKALMDAAEQYYYGNVAPRQ